MFWYIVIGLFVLYFGFSLYTRKFRNPFKLIFIFGKKGAGKSTLMVKEILKHQKRGWLCYTDMKDCAVPGVRIISALDLARFVPPPRSCMFLEEVGVTFDNRKYKDFNDGIRDFWKFMRKYKIKCFMNSQSYDVDKKIRDCVDSMILQTSVMDTISISRPIIKSVTLTEPSADSESRIAERLKFAGITHWKFMWMPKYHKYFNSFDAPPREPIEYREVPPLPDTPKHKVSRRLQKQYDRDTKQPFEAGYPLQTAPAHPGTADLEENTRTHPTEDEYTAALQALIENDHTHTHHTHKGDNQT